MSSVKISVDELKKALTWIESNSKEAKVTLFLEFDAVVLKTFDRLESEVTIKLFGNDSQMMPKITKTEILR